jgi:hypothetical protein
MLKNRFNIEELNSAWFGCFRCFWCSRSGADCFHHIISPSSQYYKKGEFNSSVLNSIPLHNFVCHLYNPELHKQESRLLIEVIKYLLDNGYVLKEKDIEFFKAYRNLYVDKV